MSWLSVWWVWVAGGVILGAAEVLLPGFIFLGFAAGAVLTGILVALGAFGGHVAVMILVFALASLGAWFAMRRLLGTRVGQVKIWDRDINDN